MGLRSNLGKLVRTRALGSARARRIYKRWWCTGGDDWAALLRDAQQFHAIGTDCSIQANVVITDPRLVSMGNNVRLSGCTLFCHDGSVNMLNRAYGLKLDAVGPIVIGDDVFIGHGAIVLPGVRIGSRVIVAAGAVVSRDVPDNVVVAGIPAHVVSTLDEHVQRVERRNRDYPWRSLVEHRAGGYDPKLEPTLLAMRRAHFFGDHATESAREIAAAE